MANFGPKLWVNPFGKMSVFRVFELFCFYSLQRRSFDLQYRERHFLGLYCLKKKVGKMANFGPKLWVKPFGKMSVFRLFQLFIFIGYKDVFFDVENRKRHFLAYIS